MYARVYALTAHKYIVLRQHDNIVLATHRTFADAELDARNRNTAAHGAQRVTVTANDAAWAGRR